MGVKYEWHDASIARVRYLPPAHDVSTGAPRTAETGDEYDTGDSHAVLISSNEVAVLVGSLKDIREVLQQALDALPWYGRWVVVHSVTGDRVGAPHRTRESADRTCDVLNHSVQHDAAYVVRPEN